MDGCGGDQRAIQTDEASSGGPLAIQGLLQVGGVVGDYVEGLVEVAVAGGLGQAVITGQAVDGGGVEHPSAHHHGLGPAGLGALPWALVMSATLGRQPPGARWSREGRGWHDRTACGLGSDTGTVSWQKPILHHPTRMHPPESTITPCQSITADVLQAALMRKPH